LCSDSGEEGRGARCVGWSEWELGGKRMVHPPKKENRKSTMGKSFVLRWCPLMLADGKLWAGDVGMRQVGQQNPGEKSLKRVGCQRKLGGGGSTF